MHNIICIVRFRRNTCTRTHARYISSSNSNTHILVYSIRMHVHAALMFMRMHASARILLDIMNNIIHAYDFLHNIMSARHNTHAYAYYGHISKGGLAI